MRPARRLASIALLSAAGLILSGCVPADPEVTPPAEPSSEAIFASDEEALAAATDAYEAYLKMSDLIAQEGGKNPERIAPLVTEEWLAKEIAGNEELIKSGRRLVGNFAMRSTSLQQTFPDGPASVVVVIYACIDPNGSRLLDSHGTDVTPDFLKSPWANEVTLVSSIGAAAPKLLLSEEEPWSDTASC